MTRILIKEACSVRLKFNDCKTKLLHFILVIENIEAQNRINLINKSLYNKKACYNPNYYLIKDFRIYKTVIKTSPLHSRDMEITQEANNFENNILRKIF